MKAEEFWKEWLKIRSQPEYRGAVSRGEAWQFAKAYHQQRIRELDVRGIAEEICEFARREPDEHISGIESILRRKLKAGE